ncbi:MAG: putative glycoside hydrolase [Rikenellaceae bacterium]
MRLNLIAFFTLILCSVNLFAQKPTEAYPDFSWDKVSVCIHLGKSTDDFTAKETKFLSRFPIVCLEKNQGLNKHGAMELGTIAAGKAIKEYNPDTKILFYFNSCIDFGEMYMTGYMLSDDANPDWAVKSLNGEYVLIRNRTNRRMYDYSNDNMREWWVSTARKWTRNKYIDGVFIDAIPKYAASTPTRKKQWGEEKFNAIYAGLHSALSELKTELNGEKLMIGNFLRGNEKIMPDMGTHFHDYTDGGMIEHLGILTCSPKEHIAKDIELIQDAAKRKKIVVVKAWPTFNFMEMGDMKNKSQKVKETKAREDIVFPLACFLVGAGEWAYFCYSWGYEHTQGGLVDYAEYNKPLGKPLGDAVKTDWVYTREFERASVWVDLESRQAKINWR